MGEKMPGVLENEWNSFQYQTQDKNTNVNLQSKNKPENEVFQVAIGAH